MWHPQEFSACTEPELLRTSRATEQKLPSMKTRDMKLDMCDAKVQKHQFSNLPAY